jgi:hypothetical protein
MEEKGKTMRNCRRPARSILNISLGLMILCIFLAGCGPPVSSKYYVNVSDSLQTSSIKSVGVWRSRAGGQFTNSGNLITIAFENAFREHGFTVVGYDEMSKAINKKKMVPKGGESVLETINPTPEILEKLRSETGVDAVLVASIDDSFCSGGCRIICSFRLVDLRSGKDIMKGQLGEEDNQIRIAANKVAQKAVSRLMKPQ